MPREFWTVQEAALTLRLHPETLRKWIRQGRLRATLRGARKEGYRIAAADLEPLFEELAERDHEREEAMAREGLPIPYVFEESAGPLRIDGGRPLSYPPLSGGPFASDEELFDYIDTCVNSANMALKELRKRMK